MTEVVDAAALTQIPWFNPKAVDGRTVNLMPNWDGTRWNLYIFNNGKAINMQIVDVVTANYLAAEPQRATDMRIPFAEIMWQRASYPETVHFISGVLDDFVNFSASVSKIAFSHPKTSGVDSSISALYVKTEIEYLLSLARGVFDLLHALLCVLWKSHVILHDSEKEKIRKAKTLPPKSFGDVALKGDDIRSSDEICAKWGLPQELAAEYVSVAPFFRNIRNWRNHVIHHGRNVGAIFVDEDEFKVRAEDPAFSWANCWAREEIGPNGRHL